MAAIAFSGTSRDVVARIRLTIRLWQRRMWMRFGVTALLLPAALALLAGLVTLDSLIQRDIQAQLRRLGRPVNHADSGSVASGGGRRDYAARDRERLRSFSIGLPAHDAFGETLAGIVSLAEARHIQLAHGEYREQVDAAGMFSSYTMVFPVTADASALQRFIGDVLHDEPYLAVAHIRAQRNGMNPTLADVRLEFILFTKAPDGSSVVGSNHRTSH